jgi:hypothetical protein
LVEFVDYIPGEKILDAIDRIVGDSLEHVVQITLRIDVTELTASCRAPDYAERYPPTNSVSLEMQARCTAMG